VPFATFLSAELDFLENDCLSPGGLAELAAGGEAYGGPAEIRPRHNVVQGCYELPSASAAKAKRAGPGGQWAGIKAEHPDAILNAGAEYLTAALVGRGLYSYQLSWYAGAFPKDSLYVICSEGLREDPAWEMERLGSWMGIEAGWGDWGEIVKVGAFNVGGGGEGYTKVTEWEKAGQVGLHDVAEMGLGEELMARVREVVRAERARLNEMREQGLFWGEDCGWE
jgi:hypothetical protein